MRILNVPNLLSQMSFNAIRENKTLAKISGFTVVNMDMLLMKIVCVYPDQLAVY